MSDEKLELHGIPSKRPVPLFKLWWDKLRTALGGLDPEINSEVEVIAGEVRGMALEHAKRPRITNEETLAKIEVERQRAARELTEREALQLRAGPEAEGAAALAEKTRAEAEMIREKTRSLKQRRMLELIAAARELGADGYHIRISSEGEPVIVIARAPDVFEPAALPVSVSDEKDLSDG
jgi:hypothetical protein